MKLIIDTEKLHLSDIKKILTIVKSRENENEKEFHKKIGSLCGADPDI